MSTKTMYDLKETLCTNLDQYARKDSLTRNDLDTVCSLTEAIANIGRINKQEEGYSYGMGRWDANGSYSNGMPMSYGKGYDRRSSHDGGNYSGNNYSNDAYDMESRMRREMNY